MFREENTAAESNSGYDSAIQDYRICCSYILITISPLQMNPCLKKDIAHHEVRKMKSSEEHKS